MTDALFSADQLAANAQSALTPVVLARKWRPKKFAEVVGQQHVVSALRHALDAKRLHHAYLLTGTRGTGKTTLARILAKALNCEQGITSEPCGICGSCQQIDTGRFVDYIEIDAASNRGVGEIQQLLEQAQFAPTAGRFKVYVIDEVHMLSNHAFNAMLKTLEEPPPDVKFLLATTDPQKIPVTVLSRCLQFNLKNVAPDTLSEHLNWVMEQEKISADPEALGWIAYAAQGSVRDSLSLADQAIAYGGGSITAQAVQQMLGLVHRESLAKLLREVAANNAKGAMAALDELWTAGASGESILAEAARAFHLAAAQSALGVAAQDDGTGVVEDLAGAMPADLLQLSYQISVLGRRDLSLAPDERTGLEMTVLRLLAFQPSAEIAQPLSRPASSLRVTQKSLIATPAAVAMPAASLTAEQWPAVSRTLALTGLARQFVQQAELTRFEDLGAVAQAQFRIPLKQLAEPSVTSKVEEALAKHFSKPCRVRVEVGEATLLTAAAQDASEAAQALALAEQKIAQDPLVQSVLKEFGGKIVPGSIRPIADDSEEKSDQTDRR